MKKSKKALSLFIALMLAVLALPSAAFAAEDADAKTLEISTANQLVAFADAVNKGEYDGLTDAAVSLTADIDMTGVAWTPIGVADANWNIEHYFSGMFYGNGHKIYNLDFSSYYGNAVLHGLFGYTQGSTIRDLTIEGVLNINGKYGVVYFGVIAAYAEETKFINCTSNLNINNPGHFLSQSNTGGICGFAYKNTIDHCKNIGEFNITNADRQQFIGCYLGGICGQAEATSITNCYNTGNTFTSTSQYGSICANIYNGSKIQNCYSTASLTLQCPKGGAVNIGGILGILGTNSAVEHCYFAGTIKYGRK